MGSESSTRSASCRRVMEKRWEGRRDYWRELIEKQSASGLSIIAFCEQEGVHTTSFYSWRRKLTVPTSSHADDSKGFVEVVLPKSMNDSGVSIEFPGNLCLRVSPGFDRECLKDVLAVFRESLG